MNSLNLLSSKTRVETPYIKVQIGSYTFGIYDKKTSSKNSLEGNYKLSKIQYPNYIQSLTVQKINGTVNTYTLTLIYPITENSDPNFFEKVFSSISKSRKIIFSYGDLSMPTFCYRDEEALVTDIKSQFAIQSSSITYTITAVSSACLTQVNSYNFQAKQAKPSDEIERILFDKKYGLQEIFYGMKNLHTVRDNNLIPRDDIIVKLEAKNNISIFEYLKYLVSCMRSKDDNQNKFLKKYVYSLIVIDDTSGKFDGPYFKINRISSTQELNNSLETYNIDIGYPSDNIVTSFSIDNNESYSLFYNYSTQLHNEEFVERINDKGELELTYAPVIGSKNNSSKPSEEDKTWWTNVTSYPVSATLTLKGLLRPAILMSYVNLNVYFFGRKHIASGQYIITKQVDQIDYSGFRTTLSLTRIAADNNFI